MPNICLNTCNRSTKRTARASFFVWDLSILKYPKHLKLLRKEKCNIFHLIEIDTNLNTKVDKRNKRSATASAVRYPQNNPLVLLYLDGQRMIMEKMLPTIPKIEIILHPEQQYNLSTHFHSVLGNQKMSHISYIFKKSYV